MDLYYPAEGRNYIINAAVRGGAQISNWRVAIFEGDYTPQDDDTAANIGLRATEITAYTEATRPSFVGSAAVNGESNNAASPAQFTLSATKGIRLFAVLSGSGKGSTSGVLLCIQRLPAARTYSAGDVVQAPVSLVAANQT